MWPWGHVAVGYLFYTVYCRYRYLSDPSGLAVVGLTVGTQFPDLVDKPLAYWWVLPEGRTLAHSLLIAVPLCGIVLAVAIRAGYTRAGTAFVIGYLTHPLADGLVPFLDGNGEVPTFLLWPLVSAPDYQADSFSHHTEELMEAIQGMQAKQLFTGWADMFVFQLWLFVIAVVLWLSHGLPPLSMLRQRWRARRESVHAGR